jgi:hypothetical protein
VECAFRFRPTGRRSVASFRRDLQFVRHGLLPLDTSHRALADMLHPAEPARGEPHLPQGREDALRPPPVTPVFGDKS